MLRLTLGLHFIIILIFIYLLKVCRLQKREKVLRDSRKNEKREVVKGKKNLLCGKCKVYVCSTDDIRIIKVCFCTGATSMTTREVSIIELTALFISVEMGYFVQTGEQKF